MARIRSDKPESYQSETLAEISLAAERTFRGMATIADDRGRLADKPAQINGELWSMRSEREPHTRDDLETELAEMVKVDLVCRYTGCDGKRYVHLVKWDAHQKIDRPSKSRLPRCPFHQVKDDYCGLHEGECVFPETSPSSPEPSRQSRETSMHSREGSNGSGEVSMLDLGPRIVDRGSVPPTAGAVEPRRRGPTSDEDRTRHVGDVVAAYVDGATAAGLKAPPANLRARVGKQARALLGENWEIDFLIKSARRMGAGEFNDLAVQVRKDDAAANGRASPRGQATADDRVRQALESGRRVQAFIDQNGGTS
jgi:hypothetical protein